MQQEQQELIIINGFTLKIYKNEHDRFDGVDIYSTHTPLTKQVEIKIGETDQLRDYTVTTYLLNHLAKLAVNNLKRHQQEHPGVSSQIQNIPSDTLSEMEIISSLAMQSPIKLIDRLDHYFNQLSKLENLPISTSNTTNQRIDMKIDYINQLIDFTASFINL